MWEVYPAALGEVYPPWWFRMFAKLHYRYNYMPGKSQDLFRLTKTPKVGWPYITSNSNFTTFLLAVLAVGHLESRGTSEAPQRSAQFRKLSIGSSGSWWHAGSLAERGGPRRAETFQRGRMPLPQLWFDIVWYCWWSTINSDFAAVFICFHFGCSHKQVSYSNRVLMGVKCFHSYPSLCLRMIFVLFVFAVCHFPLFDAFGPSWGGREGQGGLCSCTI